MHTNIKTIWQKARNPAIVGVLAIIVGGVFGWIVPEHEQRYSCPSPAFRAHFLERKLAFDLPVSKREASSQSLRAAAPLEEPVPTPDTLRIASTSASSAAASDASLSSAFSVSSDTSSISTSSVQNALPPKPEADVFPAFGHAVFPVHRAPNWGAMKTADEWERSYGQMKRADFVPVPAYDLSELTLPMDGLRATRDDPETIRILTAKLFYSTRFFGTYDVSSGEFEGHHAGIDLKLPEGMPVGSVAGGRVHAIIRDAKGLGLYVIVEHRIGDETFYSIYGHLSSAVVDVGQEILPGQVIGHVGSTGRSTSAHLHLQIDRGDPGETTHAVYWPGDTPRRADAARHTVHPIRFIAEY